MLPFKCTLDHSIKLCFHIVVIGRFSVAKQDLVRGTECSNISLRPVKFVAC